ncbi:MAG: prolipoprotein diacylglyceryl transferase [Sedimentisphaerales bacterium]|jgi:phosphatidylglycerol:prolipoprotein diacylglycerol transferase
MFPELFEIPYIHVTLKSYGLMMVIGFLAAVYLIRRLSRNITPDPQLITNAALYSLIGGVVGARLFYVIHYFEHFKGNLASVFAVWYGGLELLGGVILAITIIFFYLLYHKLPIRHYLDILAIGLMLALAFGRIGCFLNGCCFGRPTELPWAVRFPYNSIPYLSQINADLERNRSAPHLELPQEEYLSFIDRDGNWHPKTYEDLTEQQKIEVTKGKYRCLPVHPTQLYTSAGAAILCLILYFFWRRSQNAGSSKTSGKIFSKPGLTFALMFVLYGITRFFIEFLRDDNPFEFDGLTISQILGIAMIVLGAVLMAIFQIMKTKTLKS